MFILKCLALEMRWIVMSQTCGWSHTSTNRHSGWFLASAGNGTETTKWRKWPLRYLGGFVYCPKWLLTGQLWLYKWLYLRSIIAHYSKHHHLNSSFLNTAYRSSSKRLKFLYSWIMHIKSFIKEQHLQVQRQFRIHNTENKKTKQ